MSDTPRTDNLHQRYHSRYTDGHYTCYVRDVFDFARQLERELAEVTKQRDALLEGLEKLASCDWVITLPDRMDAVREIARQTLQIVKNNGH